MTSEVKTTTNQETDYKAPKSYSKQTERQSMNYSQASIVERARKSEGAKVINLRRKRRSSSSSLIKAYPNKIVNIHPALLPKFGGKGMYGNFVHEAVVAAGEKESGITIHYVDEQYDHGNIIFQASCPIVEGDTAGTVAAKIHLLEHQHYPAIIDTILKRKIAVKNPEVIL